MIAIPVPHAKPTRGDYLIIGAQAYRIVWDDQLMVLCWMTLELAARMEAQTGQIPSASGLNRVVRCIWAK